MTKVTFENATIRDVISKASKVAPTRGSAFDKAAGLMMEVKPEENTVLVRSTNLEIFYMEIADYVEIEGPTTQWRIPSLIIDGICSKLPITSGKHVTFDDSLGASLSLASGRMRAKVRLIDPQYFPTWEAFPTDDMELVPNFGASIQMVQWAAQKAGDPPLTGVHLDGELVISTNRFRIALAPCKAPVLYKPVTVPAGIFTPLMKSLGDVYVGVTDNQLLIQPDDSTQIRSVIYGNEYPPVAKVLKRDESNNVGFRKTSLLEIIDRALVMAQRERTPALKLIIGQEEIAAMAEDREIGLLGDVIETPGFAPHGRMTICFLPDDLISAINNSPNDLITMYYHLGEPMKPVRIDGGSGYEALVMPRKEQEE